MKKITGTLTAINILLVIFIGAAVYYKYYWPWPLQPEKVSPPAPCSQPITYSLNRFDKRFNISQQNFLKAVAEAEQIWEKPVSINLFEAVASGSVKINLIYDYRQESTARLQQMGLTIKNDKATYDTLKKRYDGLLAYIMQEKSKMEAQIADWQADKNQYEATVAVWNKRGGAPENVYNELKAQQADLNSRLDAINQLEWDYNAKIDDLNALAVALNKLADTLNLNVAKYNLAGKQVINTIGTEFEEGTYVSDGSGQRINIYQYDNNAELVRLLAHELGHALGLNHVDDPKAIMYRLNNGKNEQPTTADMNELKVKCEIK